MTSVEIVNLIGILDFGRELELSAVEDLLQSSSSVKNVEYNPSKVHWLQSHFDSPASDTERYVAFYRSGSCAIVGCDSITELEKMANIVNKVMEPVNVDSVPQIEIKNIVTSGDLGIKLDLEHLAVAAGLENVEYEPEQFPGLIYRSSDTTMLVFNSGKVVISGASELSAAEQAFDKFKQKLHQWDLID